MTREGKVRRIVGQQRRGMRKCEEKDIKKSKEGGARATMIKENILK